MWFWKRKNKVVSSENPPSESEVARPQTPKVVIGCVAKSILDDLQNPELFSIKYGKFSGGNYGYTVKRKGKKGYALVLQYGGWRCGAGLEIKGVNTFSFTSDEKDAIVTVIEKISETIKQAKADAEKEKDQKKLEKLFPDCYPPF